MVLKKRSDYSFNSTRLSSSQFFRVQCCCDRLVRDCVCVVVVVVVYG